MMRKSLIISLGLHGALVLAALVVLPNPDAYEIKPQESIQVDITNIGSESKKKAQTTSESKPADKPKPKEAKVTEKVKPKPKVAEEVQTAAQEPVKEEPPPPEPKKEPLVEDKPVDSDPLKDLLAEEQKIEAENTALAEKKIVEKKKLEEKKKKADEKKKAEADAKKVADAEAKKVADSEAKKKVDAEKKKQKLNVGQLEELLNKTEGESAAPLEKADDAGAPEKAAQDVQGNDDAISATIVDALVSKVKECFNVPPAAREANLSVRIHFQLNQDGSVRGQPDIANFSGDPVFAATARAAVSAIVECQTYDLPQDRYDLWQDNTLDFNPNTFGT